MDDSLHMLHAQRPKGIFLSPLPIIYFLAAASRSGASEPLAEPAPSGLEPLMNSHQSAYILCRGEPKPKYCVPAWSLECGVEGDNPTPVWMDRAPAASYLLVPAWLLMLQGTSTSHRAAPQPPCLPTACQAYLLPRGRSLHCVGA